MCSTEALAGTPQPDRRPRIHHNGAKVSITRPSEVCGEEPGLISMGFLSKRMAWGTLEKPNERTVLFTYCPGEERQGKDWADVPPWKEIKKGDNTKQHVISDWSWTRKQKEMRGGGSEREREREREREKVWSKWATCKQMGNWREGALEILYILLATFL